MVSGWWKDTGQLADMLEANRLVLEEHGAAASKARSTRAPQVEGRVVIEQGRQRRPVGRPRPGGDRRRRRASRTPTSAPTRRSATGVQIRRSEVEHSIVLAGSVVEDLETRIEASLLGRNVKLTRSDGMPKTLRLLVGDNSEIEIV